MRLIPSRAREVRRPLSVLHEHMDRLFREFDEEWGVAGRLWPAVDIAEEGDRIVVKAEIPGIDPENIEIRILGDQLELRGEKRKETEQAGRSWRRHERSYGSFVRTVLLPCPVDPDRTTAESENGILTIILAKREDDKTRRVKIEVKE